MTDQDSQETMGQYKLLQCQAEGPVARLYSAVDRTDGKKVLVRIVDPAISRNKRLQEILEELRDPLSERRVRDPLVLRILDVGKHRDSYFIVYEHFDGVPLDEFIAKGRPTLREGLNLARLMAEALRAVHERRIVHGDIKPGNILVGRNRRGRLMVKLAMAELTYTLGDSMISVCGELVGTPKYLSPEQILGRRATAASDIFSLGVILYELFSGREPFPSEGPVGHLLSNMEAKGRPLSAVDTSVPSDLSRVVQRMLAREASNRYRNVQALLDDLDRFEARLEGTAPEPVRPGDDSAFAPTEAKTASSQGGWRGAAILFLTTTVLLLAALVLLFVLEERGWPPLARLFQGSQPVEPPPSAVPTPSTQPIEPPPSVAPTPSTQPERPVDLEPEPRQPAPAKPVEPEPLSGPEKEFAEAKQRAEEYINARRSEEALRVLNDLQGKYDGTALAPRIRREISAARFAKAEDLFAQGRNEQALTEYRSILRDYPGTEWAGLGSERMAGIMLRQATRHEGRAELKQAQASLDALLQEFPESAAANEAMRRLPSIRLRQAQALMATDPGAAIAQLRAVLGSRLSEADAAKARELLARALVARATSLLRQERFEECLSDLREARTTDDSMQPEIAKTEAEALGRQALDLKAKGRLAEAAVLWRDLAERYPFDIWLARGNAEMAPVLEAAETAGPKASDASILMALADKELAQENYEGARPHLEMIVRRHPDTTQAVDAKRTLATHNLSKALDLSARGRTEEAVPILERITEMCAGTKAAQRAHDELRRLKAAPAGMVYVPAGEFIMGLSKQKLDEITNRYSVPELMVPLWFGSQQPETRINLPAYYIDRHEVTNAEYKAFVDETGHPPPPSPAWDGNQVKPTFADHPVTHVIWAEAVAYAEWAGRRLPTEAEWEKAARGTDGRLFPWGDEFDPSRAITAFSGAEGSLFVGSVPDGRSIYGCCDMVGNVQEWTQGNFTPYPEADPEGLPFDGSKKVARGAGWDEISPFFSICTARTALSPDTRSASLGFRCVKDVQ